MRIAPITQEPPVKKRSIDTSPLSPSPPPPSLTTKKNNPTSVKRQLLASIPIRRSPRSKTGPQSLGREKSPRRVTSTPSTCSANGYSPRRTPVPHPRPVASDSGTPATKKSGGNISELLHQVISKIDVVQQDIAVIKSHLISSVDVDVDTIESLLPQGNKLNSVGEVEEFQESLDDNSKRKLINAMASLQAGDNAGEISRAIMRSVMTNYCMSQFSGTGQKGKVAFIGTPLYKIILSAARKASKKTVSLETIKKEVLDVLRFAPYLPGGINYSRNKGKKSKNHLEEFPTDSE